MKINMLLSELLVYLMEDSWNPDNAQLISPKRMELSSVKQYLDEHYTEKITLDQLSAQFYINKQYLSKIFHEAYGMTIITYINQQKITHAKQLLRFTDMSLDEIAAKVGMTDANYFSRTFYKV